MVIFCETVSSRLDFQWALSQNRRVKLHAVFAKQTIHLFLQLAKFEVVSFSLKFKLRCDTVVRSQRSIHPSSWDEEQI